MNKTWVAAAATLALGAMAPAWGQPAKLMNPDVEHSAIRTLEAQGQRIEQRYYHRSAGVNRADTEMKGQQSSMIMRLDRNVVWIVAPQQGMYMEMSLQDPQARARVADIPDNDRITDFSFVTQEPVNGVLANKYQVASTDAQGERVEGYLWTSNDHDVLVKMDLSDGKSHVVMELRDLQVGPQPAALFEPPGGYRKVAMGGGMGGLGGMMGGMAGGGAAPQPAPQAAGATEADVAMAPAGDGEPGFVEEVATEATEEAKRTTVDEVRNQVRDGVNKGLKKIFGR